MEPAIRVLRQLASALISPAIGLRTTASLAMAEDVVSVALATAAPLLLKDIVDRFTGGGVLTMVLGLQLMAFVLAWASPNVATALKVAHTNRAVERLHSVITTAVLERQLASRASHFDGAAVGALLERTPGALQLVLDGLLWRAAPLALQTLATLWALALALPIGAVAVLTLTTFGFLAAGGLGAKAYQIRLDQLQSATLLASVELADLSRHAERAVLNGAVPREVARLRRFDEARAAASNGAAASLVGMVATQFVILSCGLALLLVLAGRDVLAHRLSVGGFVMAQAFALRLVVPLGGLVVSIRQAGPALETLGAVLALAGPLPYAPPPRQAVQASHGGLIADDVSYTHAEGGSSVDGVSFAAAPGELIAIVGSNGAGKSTLAQLLAGRLPPRMGRVMIGGVDLAKVAGEALPDLVLFAPQAFSLLDRTLLETGCFPPSEIDGETLARRLSEMAFSSGAQPLLLDGRVGRNGERLSGGQRQKLELARLAGTRAPVLILDEITSALDVSADRQAVAALRAARPDAIILLVTHRRHHAALADRVLHLSRGRLVGCESDAALFAQDPLYRYLWERSDDPVQG